MANKKFNETKYLGASIVTNSSDPLDGRLVIDSINDIRTGGTASLWGETVAGYSRVYCGMAVYCDNEKELYRYVGPSDANGIKTVDADNINNWRLDSSSEGSISNITNALNGIAAAVGLSGSTDGGEDSQENFGYEPSENGIISAATSSKEADELLAEKITSNELVTSAALNDLNGRLGNSFVDVSINGKNLNFTTDNNTTKTVTLPYNFDTSSKDIESTENVKFTETIVNNAYLISADVEIFNCGEYE